MSQNKYGVSASFDLGLAREIGIDAAIIYNELLFWSDKGNDIHGWVYKSYDEMLGKFPLSEYQLRSSYKILKEHGIIETQIKKVNGSPTFHYRLLKEFSFDLVSKKFSETMVSEKISETIYNTDNNHNTTDSDSLQDEAKESKSFSAVRSKEIFDLICSIVHPDKGVLYTDKRKAMVRNRNRTFMLEDILTAATNLMASSWHTGNNPNNVKYASFDFLMRNDEKVEEWLNKIPVQKTRSAF